MTNMVQLKIAVISEQRESYRQAGHSESDCAALTHDGEIEGVLNALQNLGHHTILVPGIHALVQHLAAGAERDWDLALNMSQGFHGTTRESQVPGLLEAYQVPFTFADAATIALCQNKIHTKIILDHYSIPNARFCVIPSDDQDAILSGPRPPPTSYPLFVKLVTEGSSKGIGDFNKVNSNSELERAVAKLKARYANRRILVEAFLSGREFTMSILGTGLDSQVIGVREHIWPSLPSPPSDEPGGFGLDFANRKSKSSKGDGLGVRDFTHEEMNDPQVNAACVVALNAWKALSCRDAGRVDVRFDSSNLSAVPNVLEVNPISGLLPGHSPLAASAQKNGISFEELLSAIIESSIWRINRD